MENTQSTQADAANSSSTDAPVKRWKRGDVREDGMVFWAYDKTCRNGEHWKSSQVFLEAKDRHQKTLAKWHEEHPSYAKDWYAENREAHLARARQLSPEAKARKRQATKKWAEANKEKRQRQNRAWAEANRGKRLEAAKRRNKERRKKDPVFAMSERLRARIREVLKKGSAKTEVLLGCSFEAFKNHIEKLFLPDMSWSNRSKWHVDHIVPCKAGKKREQLEALFHYTNLRPLWKKENQSKSAKLPEKHELPVGLHPKVREIWQRAKDSACVA